MEIKEILDNAQSDAFSSLDLSGEKKDYLWHECRVLLDNAVRLLVIFPDDYQMNDSGETYRHLIDAMQLPDTRLNDDTQPEYYFSRALRIAIAELSRTR